MTIHMFRFEEPNGSVATLCSKTVASRITTKVEASVTCAVCEESLRQTALCLASLK